MNCNLKLSRKQGNMLCKRNSDGRGWKEKVGDRSYRQKLLRCVRGRKGLAVCTEWCRPDATFSAQTEPLVGIRTLEGYIE
jgi:hypothetical protein